MRNRARLSENPRFPKESGMEPPSEDKSALNPNGQPRGAPELMPKVYAALRTLAESYLRQERPGHTLQPTALVHEAYMRLAKIDRMEFRDETHFARAASGAIRRVLVDHARTKKAAKRGGDWRRITLSGLEDISEDTSIDILALNDALNRLAELDERAVRVVELRFFGGMTIEETARMLGFGVTTVKEKWEFARVWLQRELSRNDV